VTKKKREPCQKLCQSGEIEKTKKKVPRTATNIRAQLSYRRHQYSRNTHTYLLEEINTNDEALRNVLRQPEYDGSPGE
jgi:hypothetical protein